MSRNDEENIERKENNFVITEGTSSTTSVLVSGRENSNGSKEVSSSSDPSEPKYILDQSDDETVESHENRDTSGNEIARDVAGVTDSVDSSTDPDDVETKALHDDEPEMNKSTPGRLKNAADMVNVRHDHAELGTDSAGPVSRDLTNSEAHVTSSIEHVIHHDNLDLDEDEQVVSSDGRGDRKSTEHDYTENESRGMNTPESRENEARKDEIINLPMETNDALVTSAQGILKDSVETSVDSEGSDVTRNLNEERSDTYHTTYDENTLRTDNSENMIESTWNNPSGILVDKPDHETGNGISSTVGELDSRNSSTGITSSSNLETSKEQLEFSLPEESQRASSSENLSYVVSTSSQRVEMNTSSVPKQQDHVNTRSVARQHDDIATSSGIPNISDVSSSDTSECAENAYEPESRSSQINLPDSGDNVNKGTGSSGVEFPDSVPIVDGRNRPSIARRSSENSPGCSVEEPSTTNFDEPTISGTFTDDHESVSGNEAESMTNEEGEFRCEGNFKGYSLTERDNIVDSSTVSPVSVTDDIDRDNASDENMEHLREDMDGSDYSTQVDIGGYLGSSVRGVRKTCDTSSDINRNIRANLSERIIDTTGFLGMNEDNNASQNTAGTSADTTGYLGHSEDSAGSLIAPEDSIGTTMGITSSTKYDIAVEAISSDEEELEEGEIAETIDDVTRNDVTTSPCDVTPEHVITSSSESYYTPDTIPISPPADSDEPSTSSSFLDFGAYTYPSTQLAGSSTQLAGSSHVPHSVFPFSALNLRSAPSSNCSSPVQVVSGANTPIRYQQADSTPIIFQPADSSNMLTPQYEPLSDDDSSESHDK
ncbi:cell wall protein RBR3-like [Dendronephthya gigantea]|uniref:cell wall protein RBR3-like n=1 Tax=Dendronephthya gigantea TaxID=151771 RepID=UPI00106C0901|nr:cell wall protein RBR3-like [Dendronephthya gigantea]